MNKLLAIGTIALAAFALHICKSEINLSKYQIISNAKFVSDTKLDQTSKSEYESFKQESG